MYVSNQGKAQEPSCQEGLLTAAEKDIKNKAEIIKHLEAICLPREVAILYCKGYQKEDDPIMWENHLADEAAKTAASKGMDKAHSLTMAPRGHLPSGRSPSAQLHLKKRGAMAEGVTLTKKG